VHPLAPKAYLQHLAGRAFVECVRAAVRADIARGDSSSYNVSYIRFTCFVFARLPANFPRDPYRRGSYTIHRQTWNWFPGQLKCTNRFPNEITSQFIGIQLAVIRYAFVYFSHFRTNKNRHEQFHGKLNSRFYHY
jgi:hypothetical protein